MFKTRVVGNECERTCFFFALNVIEVYHLMLCGIEGLLDNILEKIKRLMKEGILHILLESLESCTECTKGKLTKTKKKGSNNSNLLEIIQIDICGLFPTTTHNSKYFISFIDDFSRYVDIFLIAEKSNAPDVFKIYKTKMKHQLEKTIKMVNQIMIVNITDNGT